MRDRMMKGMLAGVLVGAVGLAAGSCRGSGRPESAAAAGEPAIAVENGQAQLFIDDHLIDVQQGLKRTLRRPKKDNGGNTPVISLDDGEFGEHLSTLEANGSILYDTRLKKYVMFALGFSPPKQGWDRVRVYRFTSPDGLNWIKGDDGKPERVYPKSRDIFYDGKTRTYATNVDAGCFHYDGNDPAYPYKAWHHFANWGNLEGLYYVRSKDGKDWERGDAVIVLEAIQIKQDGRDLHGPGDVNAFTWDPITKRFLATLKVNAVKQVEYNNYLRARTYTFVDRLDAPIDTSGITRVALLPAAAQKNGDEPWDEYYSSSAWRYGSQFVGGLKIWHGGGDYPHSRAGCAYLKLASSRDGLNWTKVPYPNDDGVPEVWIPNGPEGGNNARNDGGYMTEFNQGPLRIGDELIYYYGSSSWGKSPHHGDKSVRVTGGGIFRARLRLDGFVSVDTGTLTTRLLAPKGGTLLVNAIGPVQVELLDADGKPLGKADLAGDSVRHEVRFGGNPLAQAAESRPVRLRFTVGRGGELYSFATE